MSAVHIIVSSYRVEDLRWSRTDELGTADGAEGTEARIAAALCPRGAAPYLAVMHASSTWGGAEAGAEATMMPVVVTEPVASRAPPRSRTHCRIRVMLL